MTVDDARKILAYLRKPGFVLVRLERQPGIEVARITGTAQFEVGKDTSFTMVAVPGYGEIHVESFFTQCKALGIED